MHNGGTSSHLAELLNPHVPDHTMQLSSYMDLHVPHTNLSFGSC